MFDVDARGLSCPEPTMLAAEAMDKNEPFNIMVSEPYQRDNVERFVQSHGKKTTVTEIGSEFSILVE